MTKLFAASAYVAVISFAIAGEGHSSAPRVLAKADCAGAACARPATDGYASLAQTGPNETTVTRSAGR